MRCRQQNKPARRPGQATTLGKHRKRLGLQGAHRRACRRRIAWRRPGPVRAGRRRGRFVDAAVVIARDVHRGCRRRREVEFGGADELRGGRLILAASSETWHERRCQERHNGGEEERQGFWPRRAHRRRAADVQPGTGPLAEDDPDLHGAGLSSAVPRREHGAALLAVNKTKYEGQISQAR